MGQGVVQIHYADGSKMSVIPQNQGGGVTYSQFGGPNTHFSDSDEIPICVQEKLTQMSIVDQYLASTSSAMAVSNSAVVNCVTPLTHHHNTQRPMSAAAMRYMR
jgi:hypothetical protein